MNASGSDRETRVALFQKREIRRTIHNNAWWFVITDIIAVLTDAIDPSDYWKKMRKRDPDLGKVLQGGVNLSPLALEFATAGGPVAYRLRRRVRDRRCHLPQAGGYTRLTLRSFRPPAGGQTDT